MARVGRNSILPPPDMRDGVAAWVPAIRIRVVWLSMIFVVKGDSADIEGEFRMWSEKCSKGRMIRA